jgi:glutamate-1-semialdehyde 2,1-aminomutase
MGKSLGNGHPVSVVMGRKDHYKAATDVYATGTFWFQAGALVAAIESLKEFERLNTVDKMMKTGKALQEGLVSLAKDEGLDVVVSGAPTLPFMSFKGDKDLYYNQIFCSETTKRGVYMHPHHNWFVSAAHTDKEIDKTMTVARIAFKAVRQAMGL